MAVTRANWHLNKALGPPQHVQPLVLNVFPMAAWRRQDLWVNFELALLWFLKHKRLRKVLNQNLWFYFAFSVVFVLLRCFCKGKIILWQFGNSTDFLIFLHHGLLLHNFLKSEFNYIFFFNQYNLKCCLTALNLYT